MVPNRACIAAKSTFGDPQAQPSSVTFERADPRRQFLEASVDAVERVIQSREIGAQKIENISVFGHLPGC
jgi:hypothetical protein